MTADVLVVGAGLLGTSLALALRPEQDVLLHDAAPTTLAAALARGAGRAWDGTERVRLCVVAVPPRSTAAVLLQVQALGVASTYTHVSSVQSGVQAEVEAGSGDATAVCGGHPMAGRERSGPKAAVADLFVGRPWAVCAGPATSDRARDDVTRLARTVGAAPVDLAPEEHDRLVALVSHLPQIAASALAARLVDGRTGTLPLAGPGLQDTTRLAASDPALWREVLSLNAANLAPLVQALARDLGAVGDALAAAADAAREHPATGPGAPAPDRAVTALTPVLDLLARGAAGRATVPVKRGDTATAFAHVAVSMPDEPGQLAAVLTAAGAGGVNVEDVRVEHVPGRPYGVAELAVRAAERERAEAVLRAAGWHVIGHR